MTQPNPSSGSTGSWTDHPVAIATVAVVAGAVAVVGCLFFASGDEPPIRVKNGSIELHLLMASGEWEDAGARKNWKIKGDPQRKNDDYEVLVAPGNAASCPGGFSATGNPVTLTTDDNLTIEIRTNGKKTKIKSDSELTKATKQLIANGNAARYIREIKVGTTVLCTFSAKDANLRVAIIDP